MSNDRTWLVGIGIITLGVCAAMPYYEQRRWALQPQPHETPPAWKSPADIPLRLRGGGADLSDLLAPLEQRHALELQAARSRAWSRDSQAVFQTPPQITPMFPTGIVDPEPARWPARGSTLVAPAPDTPIPASGPHYLSYQVQDGETLESIAQSVLGDRRRAMDIFQANRDVLVRPDVVPLRTRLRIPMQPLSR